MSTQENNDSYIINVLATQNSKEEFNRSAFAQESASILNELQRIMRVLSGVERELANELPRYVSDTDFYKPDDGLEPPKKRVRQNNGAEMC
jgi:hypothetical protein